jgi:hypothetical protein
MEGHEGNLLVRTQIQSLRMSGPFDGGKGSASYWPSFVSLSLALLIFGGADPAGGFCLRTLSSSSPTAIVRPILDMVVVFHAIEGMMCKESGAW